MSTSYFIYGLLFYLLAAKGVSINYHLSFSIYIYMYKCIFDSFIHAYYSVQDNFQSQGVKGEF